MYEQFSVALQKVVQRAQKEAQDLNHEYVGTEHLLLGLIGDDQQDAPEQNRENELHRAVWVLKSSGIDLAAIRKEVESLVHAGQPMVTMGRLPQTPRTKKVMEYAMEEARAAGHTSVYTIDLLIGLIRERDGIASQVLTKLGMTLEEVRHGMNHTSPSEMVARVAAILESYAPGRYVVLRGEDPDEKVAIVRLKQA